MMPSSLYDPTFDSGLRTTQRTQTPLPARACEFKSRLRHHSNRCQPRFADAQTAVNAVNDTRREHR